MRSKLYKFRWSSVNFSHKIVHFHHWASIRIMRLPLLFKIGNPIGYSLCLRACVFLCIECVLIDLICLRKDKIYANVSIWYWYRMEWWHFQSCSTTYVNTIRSSFWTQPTTYYRIIYACYMYRVRSMNMKTFIINSVSIKWLPISFYLVFSSIWIPNCKTFG